LTAGASALALEQARQKAQCEEIHRRIASIDARARRPHYAPEAERLREQRRQLADERARVRR